MDAERIKPILRVTMEAIKANYAAGPHDRDRIFEALNALAMATAIIITGTDDRDGRIETRLFFDRALNENVSEFVRHPPDRVN
jgi:hypothetical protein